MARDFLVVCDIGVNQTELLPSCAYIQGWWREREREDRGRYIYSKSGNDKHYGE